ncbi:uncharacterized protein LOC122013798 [Zingiber officinale]|uniref:uncharacterized protein LOC122013798 n=1 Tax=Zingiber officinale TaxID=94328 RepID=UPI001C4ACCA6|nr:uncharacterized protein LOC122013798 [Zingiber officinale]
MTIDKSWMSLTNRISREYKNGVWMFVARVVEYINEEGKIRCPCNNCLNHRLHPPGLVEIHLVRYGIQQSYKIWDYHGEQYEHPPIEHEDLSDIDAPDEMTNVLDDLTGPVEIGESSESIQQEGFQTENFDDMLEEIEKELYPGCVNFSALNFLVKLMHVKGLDKWSNKSFDMLLKLMKQAFPQAILPDSHYEAKRKLRELGLGYESIHVCEHDCALFWKENVGFENCPICGSSRWVDKNAKGKKIPKKVMRYFPLSPRLKRLYSSRHTAKDMRWHDVERPKENGVLRHPTDGSAWKMFDNKFLVFGMDPRNVRLGLATDGFNPFGSMNTTYNMWHVIVVPYNMPPWKCMKSENMMLSLLIPGPTSPGKDMDVFLQPLIEELKKLWEGVNTRDAVTSDIFLMHAAVLWTINDFPAYALMSGWSTKGYKACSTCNEETPSKGIRSKIAYIGHRCFLPLNDPMRRSKQFDGQMERRSPCEITAKEILAQLEHVMLVFRENTSNMEV